MPEILKLSRCDHGSEIKERSIQFLLDLVELVRAGEIAAISITAMDNEGKIRVLDPFKSESPV